MKFSFNSSGDLALIAAQEITYNGKKYSKGEPISFFTDVYCAIDYSVNEKTPMQGVRNLVSYAELAPNTVTIANIVQQDGMMNLLFAKEYGIISKVIENIKLTSTNKRIILTTQYDIVADSIFIYDATTKERVIPVAIDNNIITVAQDGTFIIMFSTARPATISYNSKRSEVPTFKLQFTTIGNIDGQTGQMVITIHKATLLSKPRTGTLGSDAYADNMVFNIIEDDKNSASLEIDFIK